MLDNTHIRSKCSPIEDKDIDYATQLGIKMLEYMEANNLVCLAANQVGYDKQMCAIKGKDGPDVFFNPEIERLKINDGMVSVDQNEKEVPIDLPSFPKKRVLVKIVDKIKVKAFSAKDEDNVSFELDGDWSLIWQVINFVLNGVPSESVVERDYKTIKGSTKKRPNDKCEKCGRKNKKCLCEKIEV
jgi:peptide deformylase